MACKKEINNSEVLSSCPESTSKFLMVNPLGTDFQLLPESVAMECFLGIPYIKVTGGDFLNATDFIDPDLDGKNLAILYTGIPNILQDETDLEPQWERITGGGFRILIDGFNAKIGTNIFYVFIQGIASGELNTVQWTNILGKPSLFVSVQDNKLTLESDSIISNPSGVLPDQFITITLIQGGIGGYNVTWGDKYEGSITCPLDVSLSTNVGARDKFIFQYDAEDDKYYCTNQSLGFYQS